MAEFRREPQLFLTRVELSQHERDTQSRRYRSQGHKERCSPAQVNPRAKLSPTSCPSCPTSCCRSSKTYQPTQGSKHRESGRVDSTNQRSSSTSNNSCGKFGQSNISSSPVHPGQNGKLIASYNQSVCLKQG